MRAFLAVVVVVEAPSAFTTLTVTDDTLSPVLDFVNSSAWVPAVGAVVGTFRVTTTESDASPALTEATTAEVEVSFEEGVFTRRTVNPSPVLLPVTKIFTELPLTRLAGPTAMGTTLPETVVVVESKQAKVNSSTVADAANNVGR